MAGIAQEEEVGGMIRESGLIPSKGKTTPAGSGFPPSKGKTTLAEKACCAAIVLEGRASATRVDGKYRLPLEW